MRILTVSEPLSHWLLEVMWPCPEVESAPPKMSETSWDDFNVPKAQPIVKLKLFKNRFAKMFEKKLFGTLNVRIWGASKSSRRFPPSCPGIRGMTDPVGGQGWTDKRDKHPWQLWFTFIEILKIFNHDNPKHVHFLYILPQTRPPIHADCNPHFADSFLMSHHLSQMKTIGGQN